MNALLRHQTTKVVRGGLHTWQIFSKKNSKKSFIPKYQVCSAHRLAISGHRANYRVVGGTPIGIQSALLLRYHDYTWNANHYNAFTRKYHLSHRLYENCSSKVEVTVKTMKEKQKEKVEEIIKEASAPAVKAKTEAVVAQKSGSEPGKAVVPKKSLQTRIWEELVHYYHGFRLLFIDINICRKLVWRVLNGKTLTRRENKLLLRTTSDLFRLIPFSVFIIVPFMELLLPLFIRFFPGMLPSTFQTAKDHEDKLKQSLQVRIEMAKFLQQTLDEMAVHHHKDHKSEEAKQFAEFFHKIKDPSEHVSNEDIIKFAKRFEDEITLDALSREQLSALCRVLELNTMGTTNLLRFQLRVKLRSLAADDRVIAREGVDALDLFELQQACKARGMRAYGLTSEKLRSQLQEWIDLSLNEKVPPTLLLLSRAMLISDDTTTTDKLKETIRVLPEAVATKTKDKIGESEGKIDNKTKIEVIKEEERKIKEERDEEREAEKAKQEEDKAKAEILLDNAPIIQASHTLNAKEAPKDTKDHITSKDVELLSDALKSLSTDKKMVVEKEQLKEIKSELEDYKEDVEELREVRDVVKEPVHESRAAKLLFTRVNRMIGQLDKVMVDLEKKREEKKLNYQQEHKTSTHCQNDYRDADLVRIDELMSMIQTLQKTSDEARFKQIATVLDKLDADKDGVITVDEVLKVVEAISRENVKLSDKQIEEIIHLLEKETVIQAEEKLEKAIAKSMKEAKMVEDAKMVEEAKIIEEAKMVNSVKSGQVDEELKDIAAELKDNATDLNLDEKKNVITTEVAKESAALLEATEKQKEKLLPNGDISTKLPQPIPPPPSTSSQIKVNASKE